MLRNIAWAIVACAILSGGWPAALATEGGGTYKPPGVDTVRTGILSPPGWLVFLTTTSYQSDRLRDGSGKDRAGISNWDFSLTALAIRGDYVWPGVQWLGADVGTRVGVAVHVDAKASFDVQTPGGRIYRESAAKGLGDSFFAPILLGWHGETLHQLATAMVFLPTGKFDRAQSVNASRGHQAFAPAYFATWFPVPRVEVTGSLFYIINKENGDTRYKSGNELSFDFGLAYEAVPGWQVGANGYWYRQMTDDKLAAITVGDGNRGKAIAFGPFVRHFGRGWGVTLKWQRESVVENRAKGGRLYLQMAIKL